MNERTFEQIVDRLHRYVDVLSTESIDLEQVIYQLIQSTDIVFANVVPIDLPSLEQTQQQTIGHQLVHFKGDLRVPEIEKDHLIQADELAESADPFDVSSFFSTPFGWLGLKLLLTRMNKHRASRYNKKPKPYNSLDVGGRSKDSRLKKQHPHKKQKNKPGTNIKSRKRDATGRKIKQTATRPTPNKLSSKSKDLADIIEVESDRSVDKINKQNKNFHEQFKNRLASDFPDRFKLNQNNHLLEVKPDNTYKPVSNKDLVKHMDELVVLDVKFPKALKALKALATVAGVVFTIYDLYRVYNIVTDDTLSRDEKIQGVVPIIGELVGAGTGALAGGILGTAVTGGPWGTFAGAIVGGITGAFAGDIVGEVLAGCIVDNMNEAPSHPSGKDWDKLTQQEIEQWMTKRATQTQRKFIDSTSTQELESQPPVFNQPELQFKLDAMPDRPVENTTVSSQQLSDENVSQLINQYIIDKNRIKQQRQQMIRDIEQLV